MDEAQINFGNFMLITHTLYKNKYKLIEVFYDNTFASMHSHSSGCHLYLQSPRNIILLQFN